MNESLHMVDAILLDVDGTLWNSVPAILISWQKILDERYPGLRPPLTEEEIQGCMGLELTPIGKKIFPMLAEELHGPLLRACIEEEHRYLGEHGAALYPVVIETLFALAKRYKLAIVSNCEDGYIQNFIAFCGLSEIIADFESHGRTGLSKADNIKLVLARNGYTHACYVGDTDLDQNAAKEAGIPFLFASYGFGQTENDAERIDRFSDLMELFLQPQA